MQGCSRWRMRLSRRSTVVPRIEARRDRRHPKLNFGGASEAVAATEADVQLFWGEPLDGVHERIERLKVLSRELERDLRPLEFGLRITTLVRDTTEQAWADAEAKVAQMATSSGAGWSDHRRAIAVGQQRLLDLHRAAMSLTTTSTPPPANTVAAPERRGWSARPKTSPGPRASIRILASRTSYSPIRPTSRRSDAMPLLPLLRG